MINVMRGTGLRGLLGIPEQEEKSYARCCFFQRGDYAIRFGK